MKRMALLKYLFLEVLIFIHRIPYKYFFVRRKASGEILIMKIDAIGDAIVWLDSAKVYRKIYPDKKLVLLFNIDWKEIALALPYFDEFIPFNAKSFWKKIGYRFKIISILNKRKFDVVVNPTYSRNFFYQDWLIYNINATEKIGTAGDYNNTNNTIAKLTRNFKKFNPKLRKIADKWYTRLIPMSEMPEMELIRNAEFIRNAYNISFKAQLPLFPFEVSVYEPLAGKLYCVIFMGAATERRVWDVDKYAAIINEIPLLYEVVLCGGGREIYLYEAMKDSGKLSRPVNNLFGKTTLLQLISVIKNAAFIVTNETSASHITVATRTPSICILGGGHFGRFQPYKVEEIAEVDKKYLPRIVSLNMECFNCGWICKYPLINGRWKCIADISSGMVLTELKSLLN